MKKVLPLAALAACALFTGCAFGPSAPFTPAEGLFFNATTAPLNVEYGNTPIVGLRSGAASSSNILGLFALGDCSITAAARDGNLATVEYAEYSNFNLLGIYQKTTVTAYGKGR